MFYKRIDLLGFALGDLLEDLFLLGGDLLARFDSGDLGINFLWPLIVLVFCLGNSLPKLFVPLNLWTVFFGGLSGTTVVVTLNFLVVVFPFTKIKSKLCFTSLSFILTYVPYLPLFIKCSILLSSIFNWSFSIKG